MGYKNLSNKMMKFTKTFHVLILQHLDVDELITLMEVEPGFNKAISSCPHCMCRIAVHLTIEKHNKLNELVPIINSKRQYRNFKLTCGNQDEFSQMFMPILSIYYQSIIGLDVNGVMLPTNQYELSLPNLKFLKLSFCNLNALNVFLDSTVKYQKLHIQNFNEPIVERRYVEQIMRYRSVRLVNMEYIDMSAMKNLDFLYSNCVDFQFECNRKSDYSSLAKLFQVIQCSEIQIRWMEPGSEGYRLTLHRLKRVDDISVPVVDLFERRKRRKVKNYRNCDTASLPAEYFLILLEISELSWSFMKKIGNVMTNLRILTIFDLSVHEKQSFFLTFKNLEKIITISGSDKFMETETTTDRKSMKLKHIRIDPLFRLSSDNLDLMFRHFTVDDFQNAAEVSAPWNNLISKSHRFMSLLKLRLVKFKRGNAEDLTHSLKHFQNVEISCNYDQSVVPDVIKVLNYYSNFIVDLYLHEIEAKKVTPFFMPNLKFLTLHSVSDIFCGSFLDSCLTLKSVTFQNMKFTEKFFYRIRNMQQLERIHFIDIDCKSFKFPEPRIELKLKNMKHIEVSYSMVRFFKEHDRGVVLGKFLQDPCFDNIESVTLSGMRGYEMDKILNRCKNLSKIELKNFWDRDHREMARFEHHAEVYIQNIYYYETLRWDIHFLNKKVFHIGATIFETKKHIEDSQRNFLKMLGMSGKRMIRNNIFAVESPTSTLVDPLYHISSDLHDLIFQHFTYDDSLNALEVSRSWNLMCKESRILMNKFRLKLQITNNVINKDITKTFSRNHQNVYVYSKSLPFVRRFSENLRTLIMDCNGIDPDMERQPKPWDFPCLEYLTILKHFYRPGVPINLKNLLSFFRTSRRLKGLVIHESLDATTANDFFTLLRNNKDLKILKALQISAVLKYLEADWSEGIECKLRKISLGFKDYDLSKSKKVDDKLLSFLKLHSSTCEELMIGYCSSPMFKEIFGNFKKLHTFYATNGGINKDDADVPINLKITNCVLPFGLSTTDMPYLIERLPNVKKLFLAKIDTQVATSMATHLMFLTHMSYYNEFENCIQRYQQMILNTRHKRTTFLKLDNIKFESITISNLFDPNSQFKWKESRQRFRGYGRYDDDDDDLDSDEEYERVRS
ncbi:uncharacterized protein [Chironomus tepperi]|uniref:uncharacterized protein n=1 Tax=Chironomus tepperi TaxID=113505 RepID=UPI00391F6718